MVFDEKILMIGASAIVIISYFFNILAKKTNVPSVLMLIVLGVIIKESLSAMDTAIPQATIDQILPFLGNVGLVLIVLEAALDLELSREKWPVIWKSFSVAFISLLIGVVLIAMLLNYTIVPDKTLATLFAIPVAIMSSAIVIPSVGGLGHEKEEFMVYEATFSDILGIMLFYFFVGNIGNTDGGEIALEIVKNIFVTVSFSFVACYLLIYAVPRIKTDVKLFFIIAILVLLYAIGKKMHLSALIFILVFGLMMNNYKLFFRGRMRKMVDGGMLVRLFHDFHMLTLETAFVIRTFFFVIFGLSIVISSILDWKIILYSLLTALILYVVRLGMFQIFKKDFTKSLLYIAPRGLITVLLFYAIGDEMKLIAKKALSDDAARVFIESTSAVYETATEMFPGIILFVILTTNVLMTISLIRSGLEIKSVHNDSDGLITVDDRDDQANDGGKEKSKFNSKKDFDGKKSEKIDNSTSMDSEGEKSVDENQNKPEKPDSSQSNTTGDNADEPKT